MDITIESNYGAILYKLDNDGYKYLIIKDYNDHYLFPIEQQIKNEKGIKTILREIKNKIGIKLKIDKNFEYKIKHYDKSIYNNINLFLGNIENQECLIRDSRIKEIKLINYDEAYNLLTSQDYKDALEEANNYLLYGLKICCIFNNPKKNNYDNLNYVKPYGSEGYGHKFHTWDDGQRFLCKCNKCGAYVLVQNSEYHGIDDSYYKDYFPVRDDKHAEEMNKKYDGWDIEMLYPYTKILL